MKWCVLVLAFASMSRGDQIFVCPELNAQEEIDLHKIMNKWYVVEILEHRSVQKLSNSYVVDSCPIVNLRPLLDSASLKLLWTEKAGTLEYTFRIPDISRRKGYWRNMNPQNGTLAEREGYRQFVGNVYVMKAVASDMVLTFCARDPDSQLYSLLLSREHNFLQKSDKRGVHNLLVRRGLKIGSIRETCVNGGVGFRRGALDLITWTTLIVLLSSSFLFRSWQ